VVGCWREVCAHRRLVAAADDDDAGHAGGARDARVDIGAIADVKCLVGLDPQLGKDQGEARRIGLEAVDRRMLRSHDDLEELGQPHCFELCGGRIIRQCGKAQAMASCRAKERTQGGLDEALEQAQGLLVHPALDDPRDNLWRIPRKLARQV